ncbi:hypothetical protein AMTR_s00029p00034670 [Amborella trichopoda]|uniref:Pentacotripeptide-repeat region of PRORP domain-containing protein n=1 Tax=Amborella trichopoda TaxID=13333 RepID=W1PQ92_AMBTC|nr:hypothetical protein AMTR_s00029p00034670 [Amborella trichopoda]
MSEKLTLPLLLPGPPPSKPIFQNPRPQPPSSPLPPVLQELLLRHSTTSQRLKPTPNSTTETLNSQSPVMLRKKRLGRSVDDNRGKPWIDNISDTGKEALISLTNHDCNNAFDVLDSYKDQFEDGDLIGIIKALGFHRRADMALDVFNWMRNQENYRFDGPEIPIIIRTLGREGHVSAANSLFHSLREDGYPMDVYAYTSIISACARNHKYRQALSLFRSMEDEGCRPTLITYNVMLDVYGKMGMPWNRIFSLFESMRNDGVSPDSYSYNTLISACRRGSLYQEARDIFRQMKAVGCPPDKVTYNTLLDVYGKSRRHKEALDVLREMEVNGFPPTIVTYNSLVSAYCRDGLFEEH